MNQSYLFQMHYVPYRHKKCEFKNMYSREKNDKIANNDSFHVRVYVFNIEGIYISKVFTSKGTSTFNKSPFWCNKSTSCLPIFSEVYEPFYHQTLLKISYLDLTLNSTKGSLLGKLKYLYLKRIINHGVPLQGLQQGNLPSLR